MKKSKDDRIVARARFSGGRSSQKRRRSVVGTPNKRCMSCRFMICPAYFFDKVVPVQFCQTNSLYYMCQTWKSHFATLQKGIA